MQKIKQIQTIPEIRIRLNYWARVALYPLASFKLTTINNNTPLIIHLIVTESDRYSLIYINTEPTTQYDELKEFPSVPTVVLKVLKDMPLNVEDAEPVKFITNIDDIHE